MVPSTAPVGSKIGSKADSKKGSSRSRIVRDCVCRPAAGGSAQHDRDICDVLRWSLYLCDHVAASRSIRLPEITRDQGTFMLLAFLRAKQGPWLPRRDVRMAPHSGVERSLTHGRQLRRRSPIAPDW